MRSCNCTSMQMILVGMGIVFAVCRADWKTCQLEKPQEIARTEAFKAVFQPYDVVNS